MWYITTSLLKRENICHPRCNSINNIVTITSCAFSESYPYIVVMHFK